MFRRMSYGLSTKPSAVRAMTIATAADRAPPGMRIMMRATSIGICGR